MLKYLSCCLGKNEKEILYKYINEGVKTYNFSLPDDAVQTLEERGILDRTSRIGVRGDIFPYRINEIAYKYLIKRKEKIFKDIKNTEDKWDFEKFLSS